MRIFAKELMGLAKEITADRIRNTTNAIDMAYNALSSASDFISDEFMSPADMDKSIVQIRRMRNMLGTLENEIAEKKNSAMVRVEKVPAGFGDRMSKWAVDRHLEEGYPNPEKTLLKWTLMGSGEEYALLVEMQYYEPGAEDGIDLGIGILLTGNKWQSPNKVETYYSKEWHSHGNNKYELSNASKNLMSKFARQGFAVVEEN